MTSDKPRISFGYDGESLAYLDLLTSDFIDKWSDGQGSVTLNSITAFGGRTLFGDCPTLILDLEDKESVKATFEYLKARTSDELDNRFPSGIFIRTQVPLQSTKSLREYLEKEGHEVISRKKADRKFLPEELLDRTSLSSDVKRFLLDFSQGEPEHVVGIVRQVSTLSDRQQAALSVGTIAVRLPQNPQASPPWDIDDPFWRGDTKATIDVARRICVDEGQIILLLWQLRKTTRMVLDFAGMGGKAGRDRSTLAKITDSLPNYGLVVAERTAKKVGLSTALQVASVIAEYDRMIRGGSRIDSRVLLETALVKATTIIKGR